VDSTLSKAAAHAVDILAVLAQKLGTTVESLWPSFVRYTQAEAVGNLVGVIFSLAVIAFIVVLLPKYVYASSGEYSRDENRATTGGIALCAGSIICIIIVSTCLPSLIATLYAPEAAAAMKLMEMLK